MMDAKALDGDYQYEYRQSSLFGAAVLGQWADGIYQMIRRNE
jgi:hypothetical protein